MSENMKTRPSKACPSAIYHNQKSGPIPYATYSHTCDFVNTCMLQFIDRMRPNCIACVYWALGMSQGTMPHLCIYIIMQQLSIIMPETAVHILWKCMLSVHMCSLELQFLIIASCTITYLLYHPQLYPNDKGVKHRMMKYLVSVIITYM